MFKSKSFGEIDFGKGDPATKDIAKLDLSGTDVLAYASTGDPAGGLLFRTKDSEDLTRTNIGTVFTDFDAGRTNRIRYDTPNFMVLLPRRPTELTRNGVSPTRWAGVGHGLKATAGVGIQDPSKDGVDVVYAGSASFLHEATGLNLTYGTALQQQDEGTGQLQYVKARLAARFLHARQHGVQHRFRVRQGYARRWRRGQDGRLGGVAEPHRLRHRAVRGFSQL